MLFPFDISLHKYPKGTNYLASYLKYYEKKSQQNLIFLTCVASRNSQLRIVLQSIEHKLVRMTQVFRPLAQLNGKWIMQEEVYETSGCSNVNLPFVE